MDRRTDPEVAAERFYDELSAGYDAMTDFPGRFAREEPAFRLLAARLGVRTAVDAGTGTGFHALLLARLGIDVTAVDVSPAMLKKAEAHAAEAGVSIRTLRAELRDLSPRLLPPVDALFCLGNTLAHVASTADLTAALKAFRSVLLPGGTAVLHLLNYRRILRTRDRIQNVRETDAGVFVRFYDFEPGRVMFNVLRLERTGDALRPTLSSVHLSPFTADDLLPALEQSGFDPPDLLSDLSGTGFQPDVSRDLFAVARVRTSSRP